MRKAFGLLSLVMLVALSCSASISQGKNDQEVDPTAIRRDQSITTFLPVQDIEYCKGGEIPLLLDIYIPEEPVLAVLCRRLLRSMAEHGPAAARVRFLLTGWPNTVSW
jgi:hypothetical protein